MSLLWRRGERRAVTFQDFWGEGSEPPKVNGPEALPAMFAAHRTIVDTVATTPLHAYRERSDGAAVKLSREPALIQPLHGSVFAWKSQIVASMVADGNAFGVVTGLSDRGWPTGVLWVKPTSVTIDENGALPEYFVNGVHVPREGIVHIPWIVPAGKWRGISPLKAFKITLETGSLAQSWGRNWFANDTVPPVHVKSTQFQLTPEQAAQVKERYLAAVRGRRPWVTGSDWDLSVIGVPPDEQRFIESLNLTASQVATIYGLEPEDVGGKAANSLTYATVEGNERKRASRIGRPWCMRIEEALSQFVPRPQYFRFNLDATIRSELLPRMQAHDIALRLGLETQDEARILEEKEPLTPEQQKQWQALYGKGSQVAKAAPRGRNDDGVPEGAPSGGNNS